jgi:predicted amidophosphoribosyltransferase
MNLIYRYIKDFTGLIFPQLCQACGTSLVQYEKLICITCLYKLPYTNYHLDKENKLAKQFWGKIPLESCVAMLYFIKKGRVQNLMHQLKYNNQPEIGKELGRQYGLILKKSDIYYQIDGIIPVPLHPNRLKQRGYNQSEQFANGLAEILEVPVYNQILYRSKPSDSQIKMSRNLRFENMKTSVKKYFASGRYNNNWRNFRSLLYCLKQYWYYKNSYCWNSFYCLNTFLFKSY